jgi:hypothetical protein
VLCSPLVRSYLINYARPLIYTTFMPFINLAAIKASYSLLQSGATEPVSFPSLPHTIYVSTVQSSANSTCPARRAPAANNTAPAHTTPPIGGSLLTAIPIPKRHPAHRRVVSRIAHLCATVRASALVGSALPDCGTCRQSGGAAYSADATCKSVPTRRQHRR